MDIETRRPVDLLPDRESSSLADRLAQRPGIEVVCRDRAPFFAEGATAGAPQAVQVADRWHLWHNVSEAAERSIAQHRRCLRVLVPEALRRRSPSPTPWRNRPAHHGRPDTGSPTVAGPFTPPSTPWSRQGTAVARSNGSSA
ncbi:transposase [Streptomyces sp. NPDC054787]